MGLRDLPIKFSYSSKGDCNMLDDFLVPALKCSKIYKRSVGFFSSSVFELIEAGLKNFIENKGNIQIICSPELSEQDIEAITLGYKIKKSLMENKAIDDFKETLADISNHNLQLLVDLISNNQMNFMVVGVSDSIGMYHDKIGLLEDYNGDKVLFVGSPNESKNAYRSNYEKIRISMSWYPGDDERIKDDEDEFDKIWTGSNEYIERIDCTDVIRKELHRELKNRPDSSTTQGKADENLSDDSKENNVITLRPYQEQAINAWIQNGKKGFLVMATGTGKTWTAIYAALEAEKEEKLLLVICAPYKHLVRQWYEDVRNTFPECNITMISSENPKWDNELLDAIYDSKYGKKKTVIAISTIKSFCTDRFEKIAKKSDLKRMLIVDEAHRFKNRTDQIKETYPLMLGLSATPSSRKNDGFGEQLMNYFGGQVYNLPIEFAIDNGYLVHYNYYPIYVDATYDEEKEFDRYSRLMAGCYRNNKCIDIEGLSRYKRGRLRVISMAQEKRDKIQWILSQIKEEDHFIVYCGDGRLYDENGYEGIRHIQYVKEVLSDAGYRVSQFTADENIKERMQLVKSFNKGTIDSMVAIRCLDEGINIPSIKGALLLSSNDDYREFVQRRGRILRTYTDEYSGQDKKVANIYDVIVLPSDNMNRFALIELRRFYEYARLADNKEECLRELEDLAIRYELDMDEIMQTEDNEGDLDE